jgi:hypothetical protein
VHFWALQLEHIAAWAAWNGRVCWCAVACAASECSAGGDATGVVTPWDASWLASAKLVSHCLSCQLLPWCWLACNDDIRLLSTLARAGMVLHEPDSAAVDSFAGQLLVTELPNGEGKRWVVCFTSCRTCNLAGHPINVVTVWPAVRLTSATGHTAAGHMQIALWCCSTDMQHPQKGELC